MSSQLSVVVGAFMVLICLCSATSGYSESAVEVTTSEPDELKAAYLFNFAKYSKWPEHRLTEDTRTFSLCVYSNREISHTLDVAAGRLIKERPLAVRTINADEDLRLCHLVYWNERDVALPSATKKMLVSNGTLIVGEGEQSECMIAFIPLRDRIAFIIDLELVREAGLSMSSQLLKLVDQVIGVPGYGASDD